MKLNGEEVKIEVDLGNLTVQNANERYVVKEKDIFPLVRLKNTKTGGMDVMLVPLSRITSGHNPIEEGDIIWDQYDSPEEMLLNYAKMILDEHKDLSNEEMLKDYPAFIGRDRNRRWFDETLRRGLRE